MTSFSSYIVNGVGHVASSTNVVATTIGCLLAPSACVIQAAKTIGITALANKIFTGSICAPNRSITSSFTSTFLRLYQNIMISTSGLFGDAGTSFGGFIHRDLICGAEKNS
jgi:hypothetical protein